MSKIIISCDTTIALSKEKIIEYGLYVISLNAIVDGVEFHDTVDIDANKLCIMMKNGARVTTSTPTPNEIYNHFDNIIAKENPDYIIHFTISSKLSSMFNLFTRLCEEKYGERVIVVDSLSICRWMLNQVLYAKRLAEDGNDVKTILQRVKEDLNDTEDCYFIPGSLVYLRRGGRISAATASLGNLIGVVPILTFRHGVVGKSGITRTVRKAIISNLMTWKKEYPDIEKNYTILLLSTDKSCEGKLAKVSELVDEVFPSITKEESFMSLNVTAHAGPDSIGVGLLKKI